ncbi:sugar transporter [Penicillium argentinense]|uniref:Sugar transporter n=1 Tax=Penicillium argentinense TaxID=1131581 RepID=A0A9W9EI98_9EURO|nr:sugar transporter [Penicillium argentinense]KAJ5082308.1 sugar transporter [Penicillium argentinense]
MWYWVAVYELDARPGALTVIISGDQFGRSLAVMLGELIIIIGAVLQASSFELAQLIVGRIIASFGNDMAAVLPTWNGECSRAKSRGRAVMWQLNINLFGITLAYWVGYGLAASPVTGENDWTWRLPLGLQSAFSVNNHSCTIPSRNKYADQPVLLQRTVLSMIEKTLQEDLETDSRWLAIFTQGKPRFFQHVSGYSFDNLSDHASEIGPIIFQNTLELSLQMSLLISGFVGLEFWIRKFHSDSAHRQTRALASAAFRAGQAVYQHNRHRRHGRISGRQDVRLRIDSFHLVRDPSLGNFALSDLLSIFNTVYAIGTNGLAFLLPVELTPLQTRGKSVAISTGFFWLCNFFVVMISPVLISRIKYGTYILWACTILCFIPMIYFLVPETYNAALEDTDVLFETNATWLIGPLSRKTLAEIMNDRVARGDADVPEAKAGASAVEMVEDAASPEVAATADMPRTH